MKAFDLQRRDAQKKITPRQRLGRGESYTPPAGELVRISTLDDLIAGIRTITPEQQAPLQPDSRLLCVGDLSFLHRKGVGIVGTPAVNPEGADRSRRLAP